MGPALSPSEDTQLSWDSWHGSQALWRASHPPTPFPGTQGKWAVLRPGLTLRPSMSSPKHWGRAGVWESFLDETLKHEERAPVQSKTQPTCPIGGTDPC